MEFFNASKSQRKEIAGYGAAVKIIVGQKLLQFFYAVAFLYAVIEVLIECLGKNK